MADWLKSGVIAPLIIFIIVQAAIAYRQWILQQKSHDEFGERVNKVELKQESLNAAVTMYGQTASAVSQEQVTMRERIAANAAGIEALREDLSEERMAVMSKLFENDKNSSGRDAVILERIGRLEERFDVTKVFGQIIADLKQVKNQ
jgi:hypothetical protein